MRKNCINIIESLFESENEAKEIAKKINALKNIIPKYRKIKQLYENHPYSNILAKKISYNKKSAINDVELNLDIIKKYVSDKTNATNNIIFGFIFEQLFITNNMIDNLFKQYTTAINILKHSNNNNKRIKK